MYSVKKAGVSFTPKINVDPDLTGKAANFSMFYLDDATQTKVTVAGAFTESVDAPGLYFAPTVSIPTAGDYTFNIVNSVDGLGNVSTPVVIVNASIDDVNDAITNLQTTVDVVAADVDGLNGQNLSDIKATLANIETLINDSTDVAVTISGDETALYQVGETATGDTTGATGTVQSVDLVDGNTVVVVTGVTGTFANGETVNDGTTSSTGTVTSTVVNAVNSVLEFVKQIDSALGGGGSGLSALEGFTDDIENMLLGTEFLNDGVTANPFYDATNPGVAKQSDMLTQFTALAGSLTTITTNIATMQAAVDATKLVVDANKATLEDAGYGLAALKALLDTAATDQTSMLNILNDGTNGLAAIRTLLNTMDGKLDSIETKVDNLSTGGSTTATAFI